jgi:hypothetical protein
VQAVRESTKWGSPKNADAKADDLAKRLEKALFKTVPPQAQLKKMAVVLNDTHKQITAASYALAKPTCKPA